MSDEIKVPAPAISTEIFLLAILVELRKLNAQLAASTTVLATPEGMVELREDETPKAKRKGKGK